MDTLLQDLRYGFRMLRKSPGFTTVAVLSLALGIGANTAIFSLVHGILLNPLPYAQPDRLVRLWQVGAPKGAYVALTEQSRTLDVAAFSWSDGINLSGPRGPVRLQCSEVSVNLFSALGVNAERGRTFLPEERLHSQGRVVILSHGLWQSHFGGDPEILGRSITLDDVPRQVVGIMPRGFAFPSSSAHLWLPMELDPADRSQLWNKFYAFIGRLRPGAGLDQARAELKTLLPRIVKTFPWPMPEYWGETSDVVPLLQDTVEVVRMKLLLLLSAVGLVLLIACANVANLFLARAAARHGEIAIRASLGAGRSRLLRQFLTESLMVASAGGVLATLFAMRVLNVLKGMLPADTPRLAEATLDPVVLFFTGGLVLLTGLGFGLAPAWRASRVDIEATLRAGSQRLGTSRSRRRLSEWLVMVEMALMVVLVIGAGLLMKSFWKLSRLETGFQAGGLLTARITPAEVLCREKERCEQFYGELLQHVRGRPGVEAAALSSHLPLAKVGPLVLAVEDNPSFSARSPYQGWAFTVTPEYFHTAGIPLLKGRSFTGGDRAGAPRVMIVSASIAQRLWPGQDPIGKRVKPSWMKEWRTVVGVVGDVREYALFPDWASDTVGDMYLPYAQGIVSPPVEMTLVVRYAGAASPLARDLPGVVAGVNGSVPVSEIRTMNDVLSASILPARSTTALFGVFALLALILGTIGIYSVISYSVAERTHEIGVRAAMGAQKGDVLKLVVGEGMRLAAIGIVVGVAVAVGFAHLMTSLLFEAQAADPTIYAGVVLLLAGVATGACYVPARRATKVDPIVALRFE